MPESDTNDSGRMRKALLDQLRYLVDEVDQLALVFVRIPEAVFEARPQPGSPSVKELYGRIVFFDERIRLPGIERMIEEDHPLLETSEPVEAEAWNDRSMADILARLRSSRLRLVAGIESLAAADWSRKARWDETEHDLYGVVHSIIQQDTDWMRTISYRLYGVRLSTRT